jgi:hypothetical protein
MDATLKRKKRPLQFRNGIDTMRTMVLNDLHHRLGLCMTCRKVNCPDKASGSTLPPDIDTAVLIEVLNDVAERYGVERL